MKIGGTDYAPLKRIREINASKPYRDHGPWSLHDFREVEDWQSVERHIHYALRSKLDYSISSQRELFAINAVEASKLLEKIDPAQIVRKPKVDRMFQDENFARFLGKLFRFTGILNWLNLQGAWTFSLFPSTNGGRYYTLNIGTHEVAYASIAPNGGPSHHMIHMDSLVHDFPHVAKWIAARRGELSDDNYASGLERSTSATFAGDFQDAIDLLDLPGVRRAVVAYWTEALIGLQERESISVHARHHNWNAVAELKKRIESEAI